MTEDQSGLLREIAEGLAELLCKATALYLPPVGRILLLVFWMLLRLSLSMLDVTTRIYGLRPQSQQSAPRLRAWRRQPWRRHHEKRVQRASRGREGEAYDNDKP